MRVVRRYPDTRDYHPMAIVALEDYFLELTYYTDFSYQLPRPYVRVCAGGIMACRRGVRCRVDEHMDLPWGLPSVIPLPLGPQGPSAIFDAFLERVMDFGAVGLPNWPQSRPVAAQEKAFIRSRPAGHR